MKEANKYVFKPIRGPQAKKPRRVSIEVGKALDIPEGNAFFGYKGVITEIDEERKVVKILVNVDGQEAETEIDLTPNRSVYFYNEP